MMTKRRLVSALGLLAGLAAACHDNHGAATAPSATSQTLDTAQVLALAQETSETSSPMLINGGALTLDGTSDKSAPIAVTAM
jgi:hypothetical protein